MKCYVCNNNIPINKWRVINLSTDKKSNTTVSRIIYHNRPGVNQYTVLYACPRCGTIKIKTPLDK